MSCFFDVASLKRANSRRDGACPVLVTIHELSSLFDVANHRNAKCHVDGARSPTPKPNNFRAEGPQASDNSISVLLRSSGQPFAAEWKSKTTHTKINEQRSESSQPRVMTVLTEDNHPHHRWRRSERFQQKTRLTVLGERTRPPRCKGGEGKHRNPLTRMGRKTTTHTMEEVQLFSATNNADRCGAENTHNTTGGEEEDLRDLSATCRP